MATTTTHRKPAATTAHELDVVIGASEHAVGKLVYVQNGSREFSQFAYLDDWLKDPRYFDISPDLSKSLGYQVRKAPAKDDSAFFFALADTEPDAWGRRVIARAHAKERKNNPDLKALNELDYLCAVDDFSRIGALRLRDMGKGKSYLRTADVGKRTTPTLLELEKMLAATHAVEMSTETAEDLRYLLGKGTSLGGMRPKCSVLDADGNLSLGKFPSVNDERSVTRGEVLALHLAQMAGIEVPPSRVVMAQGVPVALIRRFDRLANGARTPYMSGTTLLQAGRNEEHAYTEVVDAMRSTCWSFKADAQQLWRRMVFNHLITNVDDHLRNIGFLYVGSNLWRLAPAFDLNPFPDKDRDSKTWLSEDTGPVVSIQQLLSQAPRFELSADEAKRVMVEVTAATSQWRAVARSPEIGLVAAELESFAPAFEHAELETARMLAR